MSNFFSSGHALLVGVGADLPATARDAAALNELLIDPNRAAYPEEQVRLLAGTAACREGILCAFDQLIGQVNQRPGEATVVIYFSGHGGRIEQNDGTHEYFLVPYGYNPERRAETAISGAEFTAKIEALQPRKLVVLLDCCHAGGVLKIVKDVKETFIKSPAPPDLLDKLGQGSGRVVIASSHEGEKSYIRGMHSIFTECLLEAMAGEASVDKDGYARILDTLIYLFRHVPDRAEPSMQHPFIKKVLNLGDNFPLCYYAGGSKSVPGRKVPSSVQREGFKTSRRHRLKRKYEDIQELYEIQSEKVKRMRKQLVIAVDAATTFKLEQQLLDEEARLAYFESELNQMELAQDYPKKKKVSTMQFPERRRDLLEEDVEGLHEKIRRLHKERVIATAPDKKFKLDKQIEEETARLEEIYQQINEIEQEIRREDEKESELVSFLPFANRNTEWEKVVDWPQGQYYLLDGPAGFGKTVLLYKIKEELNTRDWLCAYVSLKEYGTVAQIADHIARKLEVEADVLLEDHRRIGAELGEALAHRRREIGAEGVALLFDVEKEPWEQLIKTLRYVVEEFIPGVYTGLMRNSDYFTKNPLSFRVVVAGRYLIPRIEDFNQKYKFKHIQLRPLDYEAIREICRMCVPDDEARDEFAAHLLFYSAGHPHCIEQILRRFEELGRPPTFFNSHRDDIERVAFLEANRVYNSITRSWRRVFDISCLYRRLDHFLLQRFLEEGWVWHGMVEDEYDLFDKLKLSYLVDWADELRAHLSDGVTRRLLHIRLRLDLQQAQFEERCRKAETLCMECLDRTVEYSPYWAVETLFEYLQANVARIKNQAGRQALCKEFFQTKLPEVLNMLKQVYNPNLLKNSLIGILEEDWEFQFTLNYYLRDDHYDDTPYQKLLGYIRQHQVRHTQSNSSVNKDQNA